MTRTRTRTRTPLALSLTAPLALAAGCSSGEPAPPAPPAPDAAASLDDRGITAACPNRNPLKSVYFGDLHVHTSYSLDSFGFANRNDPAAAYEYARGLRDLPIGAGAGGAQIAARPVPGLDFAAVTDHSEFLSLMALCGYGTKLTPADCAALADQGSARQSLLVAGALSRTTSASPGPLRICEDDPAACEAAERDAWQRTREITNAANDPCSFTALHAYEWTATTGGDNLHRNVIFRSDALPPQALDYLSYPSAGELWAALDAQCTPAAGCAALTIPHNSNASNGTMWDTANDPVLRESMARYQRVVEIYQHKSASECVPGTPLSDPGCAFEYNPNGPDAAGYVRNGLARGLQLARTTGANPLAMGFIASTDTHNGAPGYTAEQGFRGHVGAQDDEPAERLGLPYFGPGGLAAVWAEENTRAAIFDALARREAYATSGTRMRVRTFALALPDDATAQTYCDDPGFPARLLAAGAAPMGGTIPAAQAPYVFVIAMADQTPLASFDIIRLHAATWITRQAIHTEVLAGAQKQAFCRFWRDPEFSPNAPALYYARVLEDPTPRWSALDCAAAPATPACTDGSIPATIQERAWTSPIYAVPAPTTTPATAAPASSPAP